MVEPSPAPRSRHARGSRRGRRRRIGFIVASVVTAIVLAALGTLAAYPWWSADLVRTELRDRLRNRLGHEVEIAELDLRYERMTLHDVSIEGESLAIELPRIEVEFDPGQLRRGRIVVTDVAFAGGSVTGERESLEALTARLRTADRQGEAQSKRGLRSRIQVRPHRIELRGVAMNVWDAERKIVGSLWADADLEAMSAEVTLRSAEIDWGKRRISATQVSTDLEADEAGKLRFPIDVRLTGVASSVTPKIAVSGVDGTIVVADESLSRIELDLAGGFSDSAVDAAEKLWSVSGSVRRDFSEGRVSVKMSSFELGRVPQVLERLPLVDSEAATVAGTLDLEMEDGRIDVDGHLSLAGLNVLEPLMAKERVRDLGFDVELDAAVVPSTRSVELHRMRVSRKGVSLEVSGQLVYPEEVEGRRYALHMRVPPVPCQSVLQAIPGELVPGLRGFELNGEFDADVTVDVDYADLDALVLDGKVNLWGCRVRRVPAAVDPQRLQGAFSHRVTMRDGRTRVVRLFTGSGTFTGLDQISPHMVSAVKTTEDAGFFRHAGFNTSQFEKALRRNLEKGEIRLGASTITMQMVKNVFLSHERTLSRKLQEMFLTWYVEQVLTKRRIMEIYLNVIEFGPGIYGVTRAAEHYFGKHPGDLTSLEAAYLATMLPSPVRRHRDWCHGEVGKRGNKRMRFIHSTMRERGHIDALEYETWKDAALVLDGREHPGEASCLGEIERLLAANHGQRALTGLLGDGPETDPDLDDFDPSFAPTPTPPPLPDLEVDSGQEEQGVFP